MNIIANTHSCLLHVRDFLQELANLILPIVLWNGHQYPILQIKYLKFRNAQQFAQGYRAAEWLFFNYRISSICEFVYEVNWGKRNLFRIPTIMPYGHFLHGWLFIFDCDKLFEGRGLFLFIPILPHQYLDEVGAWNRCSVKDCWNKSLIYSNL